MPSPLHFLNLPREIRNIIYTHLTQEIDLDWGYKILPFPLGGHCAVTLRLQRAPLSNVLLSCTQIYDEYSQLSSFQKPTVAVNVGTCYMRHLLENEPANQVRALKVLHRVRHIGFHVDIADQSGPEAIWAMIDELSQAISVLAPGLETIKVVSRPLLHQLSSNDLQKLANVFGTSTTPFTLSPPVLAGRLIPHGQQGFWNRDNNPWNLFQGEEAALGPGNFMAGEWHFVRGKGTEHMTARE